MRQHFESRSSEMEIVQVCVPCFTQAGYNMCVCSSLKSYWWRKRCHTYVLEALGGPDFHGLRHTLHIRRLLGPSPRFLSCSYLCSPHDLLDLEKETNRKPKKEAYKQHREKIQEMQLYSCIFCKFLIFCLYLSDFCFHSVSYIFPSSVVFPVSLSVVGTEPANPVWLVCLQFRGTREKLQGGFLDLFNLFFK